MKTLTAVLGLMLAASWAFAQEPATPVKKKPAAKKQAQPAEPQLPPAAFLGPVLKLKDDTLQRDFPSACASKGQIYLTWIQHDGENDVLWLGRQDADAITPLTALSEPGILHQPAIAADGTGKIWCVWGQTGTDNVVHLHARPFADGKAGAPVILAQSPNGSDTFADAATDAKGRVWVTWQSMRAGEGDIFTRFIEPGAAEWSAEIPVTVEKGGDWEPRIAFGPEDGAWVVYDSSRGNEFNLYLAQLSLAGVVKTHAIAHSPRYEARASIAPAADGKGFWIAAERGRERWGLDVRGHANEDGLNAAKTVLFGFFDTASQSFSEISTHDATATKSRDLPENLPVVGVEAKSGQPWIAYRYYCGPYWKVGLTRYDPAAKIWAASTGIAESTLGQDRRADLVSTADALYLAWPADLRTTKKSLFSGVFLGKIDTAAALPPAPAAKVPAVAQPAFAPSQNTPERLADDRHVWNFGGEKYALYFGDLHRHTDVSNCRTGYDGCIVEQFRYAYDMAKLDFLGTTDHTDIAKVYSAYEWWHNQRLADVFHAPGQFTSLYAYEREQRWPWGHRNVVFAERGGPIVYIQRDNYRASPWNAKYPVGTGLPEINPDELWSLLKASGKKVAIVSHTGATGMGTDWSQYEKIDHSIENLVEIYQGARVSYEGLGTPQPTVGLRENGTYTADSGSPPPAPPAPIQDFGKHNPGVYQNALGHGLKLGVFASSDHISQHVSYGGVYVKEFTREGILEAFQARRTIAATDKIYLEFSCNGQPTGSIFSAKEKPAFTVRVNGTAPVIRATLVRNETDYHVFPGVAGSHVLEASWTDDAPVDGENRYYLRVEQADGNMAWASPVWVTWGAK